MLSTNAMLAAMTALSTVGAAPLLTALVEGGKYRSFEVSKCGYNVTIRDVYKVFAAHQVEWNSMGKTMAWYSVITDIPKGSQISDQLKDQFYEGGRDQVKATTVGLAMEGKRVLEFGCGLGRVAFSFANDAGADVTCVDQSIHHLDIAQQEWKQRRRRGTVTFVPSTPDLIAAMGGQRFFFIHNVIVMQHMVPALQAVYMEQFCDLLEPGGRGWFQIPHTTYQGDGCELAVSVRTGGMQMHSTPLRAIQRALLRRGCRAVVRDKGDAMVGSGGLSAFVHFSKSERAP